MYHEYFPQAFVELQIEMGHHPLLIQRIQKHANLGIEVILAECCNYVGVGVDDVFDGEQLEALADTLRNKLLGMKVREAIKDVCLNWDKESWKFGIQ